MAGAVDARAPCIVGAAQRTQRGGDSPEPLDLWEEVARQAVADARTSAGDDAARRAIESLQVVYCQSWQYDDPPGRLAERLGIDARQRRYSGIGGTTPQVLVQDAAAAILEGDLDCALVVGAEALDTRRQLKKRGEKPRWSFKDPERKPFPFEAPFHPAETAHIGMFVPAWLTFALWDVARRAHLGVEPDDYRRWLGDLLAPMTEVAAANPHAWFREARPADELITPTPDNRMVGYPYTKRMVSIMDVDMAAAVVVMSEAKANELSVPQERRVYLRGWCYATDPVYVAEHSEPWRSPAMAAAATEALRCAGATVDDVAHLDLYSCFTSSINLARDALGIGEDDARPVTVTGGLPFCGGAGSDYMLHAIATMVGVLRADPGGLGLVSGVGMHLTKHVFALYSTTPPAGRVEPPDQAGVQARLDAEYPPRRIRDTYAGTATMAAYSVVHARSGEPEWGLAVCDLAEGERAYGRVEDPSLLDAMEAEEWVGAPVDLVAGDGDVNLVKR